MQKVLSIVLICSILSQASIRTAWTLHYQWNRATYIAKCENKDKPMLHCDGKCAFKKQMAAREKSNSKEPRLPDSFREIKDIQLFFESPLTIPVSIAQTTAKICLPPYQAYLPEAPATGIFRPPAGC